MTSIISGQNISGSLTSNNPRIVDPTSPFNGQFYDDFDISSVNVIDPNNLPFLLAAGNEFRDIGSVKIGETRSTNIFVQPPAGSAPGAITVVQLINTKTNSVDAQSTSSSSEPLKFVKNAEISGTDYKIRVINATEGKYTISLAGAIQAVEVVGSTEGKSPVLPTDAAMLPVVAEDGNPPKLPIVLEPAKPTTEVLTAVADPIVGDNPKSITEIDPTLLARNEVDQPLFARNFASPTPPTSIDLTSPTSDNPASPISLVDAVVSEAVIPTAVIDPIVGSETIPTRGQNPLPNERGGVQTVAGSDPTVTTTEELPLVLFDSTTEEIPLLPVGPTLNENDPRIFQSGVAPNPPEVAFTSPAPIFDRNGNFLSVFRAVGFGISATSQKPSSKVNEIGIFVVDDASGKINGIAPGAAGYLKAATDSARSIFSTLGGDFFESSRKREIVLERNTYGFFEVQDGSIADIKQQIANGQTPTNVLFSTPDANGVIPIQLTGKDTAEDFSGDYNLSVNKDELVLSVTNLNVAVPTVAIGAKSQGLAEGRTIDLTGTTGTLKVDITTKSSAVYNNNIGFYKVEDSIGTIKLADGTTVKPGDANYAFEAIKNALANTSLQAGKTESKLDQNIAGGSIYAPVVVSQGSLSDFIAINPNNIGGGNLNAYFNYVPANSDKKDHFRLLGNNTFGVEDQLGGGDRDFNDLVINVNVKA